MSARWLIAICLSISMGCHSKPSAITVHLTPTPVDCVVGEPLRFGVSIKNVSSDTLRVLPIETLTDGEMLFTYFEVRYPGGRVERRRYQTHIVDAIWNFTTTGAPLAPGDSLYFLVYPEMTGIRVDQRGKDTEHRPSDGLTFPIPGRYRLRAVVHIWPEFKNLYTGTWRSNEVTLVVHDSDSVGTKILEQVRTCGSLSQGDAACASTKWEQLIQEHPAHPMIKYARLALAHSHMWGQPGEHNADLPRAIDDYRSIAEKYPDLYPAEVQLWLAKSCRYAGRQNDAQKLISDLMSAHPELWTDYRFAWAGAVIGTNSTDQWIAWKERERVSGAKPLDLIAYRHKVTN